MDVALGVGAHNEVTYAHGECDEFDVESDSLRDCEGSSFDELMSSVCVERADCKI